MRFEKRRATAAADERRRDLGEINQVARQLVVDGGKQCDVAIVRVAGLHCEQSVRSLSTDRMSITENVHGALIAFLSRFNSTFDFGIRGQSNCFFRILKSQAISLGRPTTIR